MSLTELCTGFAGSATFRRKRNIRSRTDPGFPTPGARMTVVTQTPSNYIFSVTAASPQPQPI